MNQFVIVLGFVILSTLICAPSNASDPRNENVLSFVQNCKLETNSSDDDVEIFLKRKVPKTTEGACLYACIKKKSGLISADGRVNLTVLELSMAPLKKADRNSYDKLYKIFEDCKAEEILENECVMSKKFTECVIMKKEKLIKTP